MFRPCCNARGLPSLRRSLTASLVLALLAGVARGEEVKTDLYGDPLPPGAVARLGTVRLRHVNAEVAFSKDGKRLVSCNYKGRVRIWDAATGKLQRQKRLPWGSGTWTLAPDGATAAIWEPDEVLVCDTDTGAARGRIPSLSLPRNELMFPTFSLDGRLLAVQAPAEGKKKCVPIWDVVAKKKLQTLALPAGAVLTGAAFSWDGKRLAGIAAHNNGEREFGAPFELLLWDVATGRLIAQKKDIPDLNTGPLAFAPDGKTLAAGGYVGVLLDAATLKPKAPRFDTGRITRLLFSPDGRWLAAGYDEASAIREGDAGIMLWEMGKGESARRLPARSANASLAFSPDSKILACHDGSAATAIRLYDVALGRPLQSRPGHDRPVVALAASPDGKTIASGDADGVVRLWDAATSKQRRMMQGRPFETYFCRFSLDGESVLAAGMRHSTAFQSFNDYVTLQVWHVADGKSLRRIEMEEGSSPLYDAALSADGKRLTAIVEGDDRAPLCCIIWDVATGKRLFQHPLKTEVLAPSKDQNNQPPETIVHAAFAPDGERMIVWLGERVGLVEVATGCVLAELPRDIGTPLVFSPDGQLAAAPRWKPCQGLRTVEDLRGISLIETASGQEILLLKRGEDEPLWGGWSERMSFTPDGRRLLIADEEDLTVWDTDTGAKLHQRRQPKEMTASPDLFLIGGQHYHPSPLVILPRSRLATSTTGGDILIWDLTAALRSPPRPADKREDRSLDALWADLAGDAPKAHRAIYRMATTPAETVAFLKDHIQLPAVDTRRVERLLADLDGDSFAARQAAARELTRRHYRIEPMLRRALEGKPSLELRRRVQTILATAKKPQAGDLRRLRAIAVLERIGSPEARRILKILSESAAAPETREAKAALWRLERLAQ